MIKRPSGYVRAWARRNGELIWQAEGKNLVVDGAAVIWAKLALGTATIAEIGIGTSGDAPDASDVGLADEWRRPLLTATAATSTSVAFAWRIYAAEMPTMTAREMGLFGSDGTLIARKVWSSPQAVAPGVELEGTWTLVWG